MLRDEGYTLVLNPVGRLLCEEELIRLIPEADGLIVGLDPISSKVLERATRLKVISKYGVGTDNIDLGRATQLGIMVLNTPGTNSSAVAELAFGLMLDVARHISESDRQIRQGKWQCYEGVELWGKTLGILGTGQTGRQLALRAKGFNMHLICHDIREDEAWAHQIGVSYLPLKEVLAKADFLSLHIPLTDSTYHIMSAPELGLMKKSAILINTARGELVDEKALYEALVNHRLGGAGLDVLETDPPVDSPLTKLDNVVLTSHIGAHTKEATEAMGKLASQNLIQALSGQRPQFIVNPEATEIGQRNRGRR
jgi:D-3-phosphoglycerate dehydrogenase